MTRIQTEFPAPATESTFEPNVEQQAYDMAFALKNILGFPELGNASWCKSTDDLRFCVNPYGRETSVVLEIL